MQGTYSEIECLYFKRLLDELIVSTGYYLPSHCIFNLCTSVTTATNSKKITKQRAQVLIDEWCENGYFVEINDRFYFGPRTIGEFGNQFRTTHPDFIHVCFLCNQISFQVSGFALAFSHLFWFGCNLFLLLFLHFHSSYIFYYREFSALEMVVIHICISNVLLNIPAEIKSVHAAKPHGMWLKTSKWIFWSYFC